MASKFQVSTSQINQISDNPAYASFIKILKRSDSAVCEKVCEPGSADSKSLCFVSTEAQLQAALSAKVSALVFLNQLKYEVDAQSSPPAVYSAASISAAMALILPLFDHKKSLFPPGIHPSASVDPTAILGKDVHIGACAVIGPLAQIGDGSVIAAQSIVEQSAQVGVHTILHSQVFIGARCQVGDRCEIHPHTTIGADGFGYVLSPDGKRNKIPQLGIAILENDVEIGAQCAVDRATLGETRIGQGSKFDNFCHVGHNCKIGKNNVFAAGFAIAGSSEVGDNCTIAGGVLVSDHVKIGNQIVLGGKSGVTKDISGPAAFTGYPLQPLKDGLKTTANLIHLTGMRKQIAQIRRHLGLTDEEKS